MLEHLFSWSLVAILWIFGWICVMRIYILTKRKSENRTWREKLSQWGFFFFAWPVVLAVEAWDV